MSHDLYPLPSEPYQEPEAPQYAPNPNDPAEAAIAEFYAQPFTPGEPVRELPQPVEVPRHGQLTGPVPERPVQQEQPQYQPPTEVADFHAQHAAQYAARQQAGEYRPSLPQGQELVPARVVDPARIGFRGLVGRMRDRIGRR
jgi:hypothetical protein